MRLENKVNIRKIILPRPGFSVRANDPVRLSGSESIRVIKLEIFRNASGDSGRVKKERVCRKGTNTFPTFDPDQLVHQKIPVCWIHPFCVAFHMRELYLMCAV
jgi:hypothetical protein